MTTFSLSRFFALTDACRNTKDFVLWTLISFGSYSFFWGFSIVRYVWTTRAGARLRPMLYLVVSLLFNPVLLVTAMIIAVLMDVDNATAEDLGLVILEGLVVLPAISFLVSMVLVSFLAGDVEKALADQGLELRCKRIWLCLFQNFYLRYRLHNLYMQLPAEKQVVTADFDLEELLALHDSRFSTWRFILYCILTLGMYAATWEYMLMKYMSTSTDKKRARAFGYLAAWGLAGWATSMPAKILESAQLISEGTGDVLSIILWSVLVLWFVVGMCRDVEDALAREGISVKFRLVWIILFPFIYPFFKLHRLYVALQKEQLSRQPGSHGAPQPLRAGE